METYSECLIGAASTKIRANKIIKLKMKDLDIKRNLGVDKVEEKDFRVVEMEVDKCVVKMEVTKSWSG